MHAKKKPSPPPAIVESPYATPDELTNATLADAPTPTPATQRDAHLFVAEYVALMDEGIPAEIARLAATIAAPAGSDAPSLVSQAIAIRIEAERAIAIHRATLIATADWTLLNSLRAYFLTKADAPSRQQADKVDAYIKEGQRREWREIVEKAREAENSPELQAERIAFLAQLEDQCGQKLPPLPCSLEAALRWATGAAEKLPWTILKGAFDDYLTLGSAKHLLKMAARADDRNYMTEYIAWHGAIADNEANSEASRAEHRQMAEKARTELKYLDDLEKFVATYAPGKSWPVRLIGEIREAQNSWHERPLELWQTASFELLATKFREFWNEHGYQAKWQAIHDKQSLAGTTSNQKRNPRFWNDALVLELVKSFAGKFTGPKRTAENARSFSFQNRDQNDVHEILGMFASLKALPEEKAVITANQTLSHAEWRTVKETADGSAAGTTARKKSGRLRAASKGINVTDSTLRECLKLIRDEK